MIPQEMAVNWISLVPVVALCGSAVAILILKRWSPRWQLSAWISITGFALAAVLGWIAVLAGQGGAIQAMLALDGPALHYTVLCCTAGTAIVLLDLGSVQNESGDRYALLLLALAGAVLVAMSVHALPLILGLAIALVATSALVAANRLWIGFAACTSILLAHLLGLALLYGTAGSLRLDILCEEVQQTGNPLGALGLALLLGGQSAALGIVPFHVWMPDLATGEGDQRGFTPSLLLPLAAMAVWVRMSGLLPEPARALVAMLGALTMFWGYGRALLSTNALRALGGLVSAQYGAALVRVALGQLAADPSLLYAPANAVLNLICLWSVVTNARREDGTDLTLDDLAGIGERRPWLAVVVTICLLNLAHLPPLMGGIAQLRLLGMYAVEGWWLGAGLAGASTLVAWLVAGRWMLAVWRPARTEREWLHTTPEVLVIALLTATAMVAAGVGSGAFVP